MATGARRYPVCFGAMLTVENRHPQNLIRPVEIIKKEEMIQSTSQHEAGVRAFQ